MSPAPSFSSAGAPRGCSRGARAGSRRSSAASHRCRRPRPGRAASPPRCSRGGERPPSSSCAAWMKSCACPSSETSTSFTNDRPSRRLGQCLEPVSAAGTERHARAGGRQGARCGLTDSRRGAGHGRHSAFERSGHGPGTLPASARCARATRFPASARCARSHPATRRARRANSSSKRASGSSSCWSKSSRRRAKR